MKIKCPNCGRQYWWKRNDRIKYDSGYDVPVYCECGLTYYIGHGLLGTILKVRRTVLVRVKESEWKRGMR